jgi:hypothetical protein
MADPIIVWAVTDIAIVVVSIALLDIMALVSAIVSPVGVVALPAVGEGPDAFGAMAGDPAERRKAFHGAKTVPLFSSTVSRAAALIVARRLSESAVECLITNVQAG